MVKESSMSSTFTGRCWQLATIWCCIAYAQGEVEPHISELVCAATPRPQAAVCIVGNARSFPHKIVHRSLQDNLVLAFGADTTVFAIVRSGDARGEPNPAEAGLLSHESKPVLDTLLKFPEIASWNIAEQRNVDKATCTNETWEHGHSKKENTPQYLQSFLSQVFDAFQCYKHITKYEQDHSIKFDFVFKVRADLTWFLPVFPYCLWDMHAVTYLYDWAWAMPRHLADKVLEAPWLHYQRCDPAYLPGRVLEDWLMQVHRDVLNLPLKKATMFELPCMITRIPKHGFPNNVCEYYFTLFEDIPNLTAPPHMDKTKACMSMTVNNPWNKVGED